MQTETNIKALKGYTSMPLPQKIEANRIRQSFFKGAISLHISIKRKSVRKALKEFRDLYDVEQYFCTFWNDSFRKDDSIKVWFTTKPQANPRRSKPMKHNPFQHLANRVGAEPLRKALELDRPTFNKRLKGILPPGANRRLFIADWRTAARQVIAKKRKECTT